MSNCYYSKTNKQDNDVVINQTGNFLSLLTWGTQIYHLQAFFIRTYYIRA